jgi:hypothetical protein
VADGSRPSFCAACGTALAGEARFCASCGAPVADVGAAATASTSEVVAAQAVAVPPAPAPSSSYRAPSVGAISAMAAGAVGVILSLFVLDWVDLVIYDQASFQDCIEEEISLGAVSDDVDEVVDRCMTSDNSAEATLNFDKVREAYNLPGLGWSTGSPDSYAGSYLESGWIVSLVAAGLGVAFALTGLRQAWPWTALLVGVGLVWHSLLVINVASKDASALAAGAWVGAAGYAAAFVGVCIAGVERSRST